MRHRNSVGQFPCIFHSSPQSVCVGCISFLALPSQITTNWVISNNKKFILTVLEAESVKLIYQRSRAPSEGSREEFFPNLGAFPTSSLSLAPEYILQSLPLSSCSSPMCLCILAFSLRGTSHQI